jgi:outer membrane protein assembly factor BamB
MNSDTIFLGGAGHVFALCRNSGDVLWETELKPGFFKMGKDFVSLLETKKGLFAFAYGTLYRIDPLRGDILWQKKIDKLKNSVGIISTDCYVSFGAEIASGGDCDGGGDGSGDGGDGGGD